MNKGTEQVNQVIQCCL